MDDHAGRVNDASPSVMVRVGLPLLLLAAALVASGTAAAQSTQLCFDDRDGVCEVNLFVSDALIGSLGTFLVCDTHILAGAPDSSSCPATSPGVYFSCTPSGAGYCNATVIAWGSGTFKLDVTATVGTASLTMGGFGSGTYAAKVDSSTIATFNGTNLQAVSVTTGGARRVEFVTTAGSTPGSQEGGPPPAAAAPSGPEPVIVNVGPGAALPGAAALSGEGTPAGVKIGLLILGVALVAYAEAKHLLPMWSVARGVKPRHWLAVVGVLIVALSVLSLAPAPASA